MIMVLLQTVGVIGCLALLISLGVACSKFADCNDSIPAVLCYLGMIGAAFLVLAVIGIKGHALLVLGLGILGIFTIPWVIGFLICGFIYLMIRLSRSIGRYEDKRGDKLE